MTANKCTQPSTPPNIPWMDLTTEDAIVEYITQNRRQLGSDLTRAVVRVTCGAAGLSRERADDLLLSSGVPLQRHRSRRK